MSLMALFGGNAPAARKLLREMEAMRRGFFLAHDGKEHPIEKLLDGVVVKMAMFAVMGSHQQTATGRLRAEEAVILQAEMKRRGIGFPPHFKLRYLTSTCSVEDCSRVAEMMVGQRGYCGKHKALARAHRAHGAALQTRRIEAEGQAVERYLAVKDKRAAHYRARGRKNRGYTKH